MKKLYVGNLPYNSTEEQIKDLFEEFGTIQTVDLIIDRETGRPRGFAFVEMEDEDADAAASALDGTMFGGRNLRVNEARPREERPRGGGRGRGGYGGGGSRGGGGGRGGRRYDDDW